MYNFKHGTVCVCRCLVLGLGGLWLEQQCLQQAFNAVDSWEQHQSHYGQGATDVVQAALQVNSYKTNVCIDPTLIQYLRGKISYYTYVNTIQHKIN